jgi:anti-sigma factor RsiW
MIDHERARELALGLLAGTLSATDEALLRAHLDRCAECSCRLEVWRRLVGAVKSDPESSLSPAALARITRLAQARREQVLRDRRQAWLTATAAILGWLLVLTSIPIWQFAADEFRAWAGWPGATGPIAALVVGALLSYMFVPGLAPLLTRRRRTAAGGGRR